MAQLINGKEISAQIKRRTEGGGCQVKGTG